jgi:hypothetical protein
MKFENYAPRKDNIFTESPYPGDRRFQPPSAHDNLFSQDPKSLSQLSKYPRVTTMPRMDTQLSRPSPFKIIENQPDYQTNYLLEQQLAKKFNNTGKNVGAIEFSKRPVRNHDPIVRPYFNPEPKDINLIEQGEKALGIQHKIKGKVEIGKQTSREDNLMF